MDDNDYIAYEFNKARIDGGQIHVKMRSDSGESRWVGIPAGRLDALITAAQDGTGEVRYLVDGETVTGGQAGESWIAIYRVPVHLMATELPEADAEQYGKPRFERAPWTGENGS